jgi:serine/threonine-protein kinase
MNRSTPAPTLDAQTLSADPAERLGQLWLQGHQPDLDEFLGMAGSLSPAQLAAAVRVDQAHRWRNGERILAEAYLRRFPQFSADLDSAIDLIYGEFILRERNGEQPDLGEYLERFPEHASVLEMQIELHRAIQDCTVVSEGTDAEESAALVSRELADTIEHPTIPNFEILSELGRGGMGVIYKARQVGLNRIVALKVILAGVHAAPSERTRFRTEAEAAARLCHPHVVQIYEVGSHQGLPFLALEYMDGGSLATWLTRNRLSARQAAELVEVLARTVQAAHDHGIVHRDLKPANVLLKTTDCTDATANGEKRNSSPASVLSVSSVVSLLPKISDFGLAKCLHQEGGQTSTGAILGTPQYMAPEQASGQTREIGPAADIHALGAILYETLTGRPPFGGATLMETLDQVRSREPVSPSRIQPGLPRDLVTVCLKALAKEPSRRYATAAALADDLRRFLSDQPVSARPVTPWERGWRWCRRNPLTAGLSSAAAVLLLCALAGLGLNALVRNERDQALANLERAEKAEAEARDLQRQIKISEHLARATALRCSRQSGQRFNALAEIRAAMQLGPGADMRQALRIEACAALALPDIAFTEGNLSVPAGNHAVDPTLSIYASTDKQGNCSIRRMADGSELYSLPGLNAPAQPYLSRDGTFVAVVHYGDQTPVVGKCLKVWKLGDGRPKLVLARDNVYHVDFHPTRPLVALAYTTSALELADLDSGKPIKSFEPSALLHEVWVALHPTEPLLAACSYFSKEAHIHNWKTGELIRLPRPKYSSYLAWHPDGHTLAISDGISPLIHLYDRATWRAYRTLKSTVGGGVLIFNHAGDRLIRTDWSGQVKLFDLGTGRKLMETAPVNAIWAGFSSDDARLCGGVRNGKLGTWQVGDGRELRLLGEAGLPDDEGYLGADVSPDGRLLAAARTDGFGLWDLASGSELAVVPFKQRVLCVRFERSGALLMTCQHGLLRWPIREEPGAAGRWTVGPPDKLLPCQGTVIGQSRDGKVIVTCCRAVRDTVKDAGGWILHVDHPAQPIRLDAGADIVTTDISPDGRWVVTSTHWGGGQAKIWDARTGQYVKQLVEQGGHAPHFTPEGRWLATDFDEGRLFAVGTWKPGNKLGGRATFSPKGSLAAVYAGTSVLALMDRTTGREVARLDDPNGGAILAACFTPDGTRLITLPFDGNAARQLRVWDLRLLRRGLKELNLDWDGEPSPPILPQPVTPGRPTATVDLGDLQPP